MLKLDTKKLDAIRHQYSEGDQQLEMFKLWLSTKGEKSTRRVLIDALTAKPLAENALVETYKKYLDTLKTLRGRVIIVL